MDGIVSLLIEFDVFSVVEGGEDVVWVEFFFELLLVEGSVEIFVVWVD